MAKRALLVGINRYRIPGADLRGCVNDVEGMATLLKRHYGFPKSRVRVVKDFRATTERMRQEIARLVEGAKEGDTLFFQFSGHGSNVPDADGDEADRRDEILCPTDLDWYDPISDDELRTAFDSVPSGASLTVVLDCCHSGTATRRLQSPFAATRSRYLPCPLDLMAVESGRALRGRMRSRRRSRRGTRRADVRTVNIPEVLLTGCRDTQKATDALIDGQNIGAMSYALQRTIEATDGDVTYRALHRKVKAYLRENRYKQDPQLEGRKTNLDRRFLEAVA